MSLNQDVSSTTFLIAFGASFGSPFFSMPGVFYQRSSITTISIVPAALSVYNIYTVSDGIATGLAIALSLLAFINGIMLLRSYLRDRPILEVTPVHPDAYQWFFRMPDGNFNNIPTRRYGFLIYIDIKNKGIRDVALCEWHLIINTRARKQIELKPITIPEPQLPLGQTPNIKAWPVLGTKGVYHQGDTMIKSGDSIGGFAYYVAEVYGSDDWNPTVENGKATTRIRVRGVFGKAAYASITLTQKTLDEVSKLIPNIDQIDKI